MRTFLYYFNRTLLSLNVALAVVNVTTGHYGLLAVNVGAALINILAIKTENLGG